MYTNSFQSTYEPCCVKCTNIILKKKLDAFIFADLWVSSLKSETQLL